MDVDSLRDEFESNAEWRLRRKFLELNADNLNHDRLVCLSRCFVNMAVYQCSYPPQVIREIQMRSSGILDEVKAEKKSEAKHRYAVSFVKASDDASSTSRVKDTRGAKTSPSTVLSSDNSGETKLDIEKGQQLRNPQKIAFVKSKEADEHHTESEIPGPSSVELMCSQEFWDRGGQSFDTLKGQKTTASAATSSSSSDSNRPNSLKKSTLASSKADHIQQASQDEQNPVLQKIRKLAVEVSNLKSTGQNAKVLLDSAHHRVPIAMTFETETVPANINNLYICHVFLEGIFVASGKARKIKEAKTEACESALKIISMPYMQLTSSDNDRLELQTSEQPFPSLNSDSCNANLPASSAISSPSFQVNFQTFVSSGKDTVSHINSKSVRSQKDVTQPCRESNMEASGIKRKFNEFKSLENFVIVEPFESATGLAPAQILRQSADFNQMVLEFEFLPLNSGGTRCIVRIEGEVMADVVDFGKAAAKHAASSKCLERLRPFCWVLKTKRNVDSESSISKEEVLAECKAKSDAIGSDNVGNKLLRKMGWTGGGVGKEGTGIAEPVSLTKVVNREGLGLSETKGIPADFRIKVRKLVHDYACSDNQEELVFSSEFEAEERKIIHDESRKLNLKSTSRGSAQNRILSVSRKRSPEQMLNHIMSRGGETVKYKLIPPPSEDMN